jgi:hypothetical protein
MNVEIVLPDLLATVPPLIIDYKAIVLKKKPFQEKNSGVSLV